MRADDDSDFVLRMRGIGMLMLGAGTLGIVIAALVAVEREAGASLAIALGSAALILGASHLLRGMR